MAEAENEEVKDGEGSEEAKEKGAGKLARNKGLIIGAVILVILVIQVFTAYYFARMIKGEDPSESARRQMELDSTAAIEMLTKVGMVLDQPMDITVNIAGQKGSHYLKSTIQLEWDPEEFPDLKEALDARLIKIKDIIIDILSVQSIDDLKMSSGKKRVKEAILADINVILPKDAGRVEKVLFEEFIIQ